MQNNQTYIKTVKTNKKPLKADKPQYNGKQWKREEKRNKEYFN